LLPPVGDVLKERETTVIKKNDKSNSYYSSRLLWISVFSQYLYSKCLRYYNFIRKLVERDPQRGRER